MGNPDAKLEYTDVEAADPNVGLDVVDAQSAEAELVEEDLLIEDVSIDGMCGVY